MSAALRRLSTVLAAATCTASLVACSVFDSGSRPTLEDTTSMAPTESTSTTVVEAPTIELIDPGAQPRQLLRYSFAADTATDFSVQSELTVRQTASGQNPVEVVTPSVVHRVRLSIGDVTGDEATISLEFLGSLVTSDLGVSEAEATAVNDGLAALSGIEGTGTITSDGRLRAFTWTGFDELDEDLRQNIDALGTQLPGLVAPMPGAAVGVGAKWTARSTVALDGVPTEVATTYTLDGVLGSGIAYSSVSEIRGPERVLPGTTNTDGTITILESSATTLTTGTLDLTSLANSVTSGSTTEQRLRIERGGSSVEVDQTITNSLAITPAE